VQLCIEHLHTDFERFRAQLGPECVVINCIGRLPGTSPEALEQANTTFPRQLATLLANTPYRLIHISTDAVFAKDAGIVFEDSVPHPDDLYGQTKKAGEIHSPTALTIRTSLLGFNAHKNTGLLEWIRHNPEPIIDGYSTQQWSGCTTLQYAQLCEFLADDEHFHHIRSQTSVLHFAPLVSDKYTIVHTTCQLLHLQKEIKRVESKAVTRVLRSHFNSLLRQLPMHTSIEAAIDELLAFEKNIPYIE
ncbi:sugar nucleotide-binding protein, partial [Candidatus Woesebacteria bacterium]|nr:sugar nucleotide-binding protein [Candidatus Woesebacteria bacterium]